MNNVSFVLISEITYIFYQNASRLNSLLQFILFKVFYKKSSIGKGATSLGGQVSSRGDDSGNVWKSFQATASVAHHPIFPPRDYDSVQCSFSLVAFSPCYSGISVCQGWIHTCGHAHRFQKSLCVIFLDTWVHLNYSCLRVILVGVSTARLCVWTCKWICCLCAICL